MSVAAQDICFLALVSNTCFSIEVKLENWAQVSIKFCQSEKVRKWESEKVRKWESEKVRK